MTAAASGRVFLVGAGPGDPELLTLKAARLLESCDVVLHDDLVPPAVLALVRRKAWVVNVGKRCGEKRITQEEINNLMIDYARQGNAVVRLKSGDPLIFSRAAEEMDALRSAGVEFEVVPGITSAFAAAAALECSLTDRRSASRIVFSSGHHAAQAPSSPRPEDASHVVYMPGRDLTGVAEKLLASGLRFDTPCAVVSHAARPGQQVERTTLRNLHAITPGPSPVLVLAGWALCSLADTNLVLAGCSLELEDAGSFVTTQI